MMNNHQHKELTVSYYEKAAISRPKWKKRNQHYHKLIESYYRFLVPENSSIMELGCSTGDLLSSLKPSRGVGVDFSPAVIEIAREKYPHLEFIVQDIENLNIPEKFDFVILSDVIGSLWDVQLAFERINNLCHPHTRIIVSYYNFVWEPILQLAEFLRLKQKQPLQNWLSSSDIQKLLKLTGKDPIRIETKILLPVYIPIISAIFNRYLVNLPLIKLLSLSKFIIARPEPQVADELSVSIIIPARNEKGNIENAILSTPDFGKSQEFIFVEGGSLDGTFEEIQRVKDVFPEKNIQILKQTGRGKVNAVREGFDLATGDILMILDADLTTPPEDLPKFYNALKNGNGEFINGCRLVYPMENQAMRLLNLIANKFFGVFFSYLMGQRVKDTLCGTKVLLRSDYKTIEKNRAYFGDFDPFGDFDLLFGAAKMNLKITEIIVRYRDRQYGSTQIQRFRHGLILFRMSFFGLFKLKFIR
jgi:SAM-dependent methyltransferase